jgi:hypothetical protein
VPGANGRNLLLILGVFWKSSASKPVTGAQEPAFVAVGVLSLAEAVPAAAGVPLARSRSAAKPLTVANWVRRKRAIA